MLLEGLKNLGGTVEFLSLSLWGGRNNGILLADGFRYLGGEFLCFVKGREGFVTTGVGSDKLTAAEEKGEGEGKGKEKGKGEDISSQLDP